MLRMQIRDEGLRRSQHRRKVSTNAEVSVKNFVRICVRFDCGLSFRFSSRGKFAHVLKPRLFIGVYGALRLRSGQARSRALSRFIGCRVLRSLLSRALPRFMPIAEIFRSLLSYALSRNALI